MILLIQLKFVLILLLLLFDFFLSQAICCWFLLNFCSNEITIGSSPTFTELIDVFKSKDEIYLYPCKMSFYWFQAILLTNQNLLNSYIWHLTHQHWDSSECTMVNTLKSSSSLYLINALAVQGRDGAGRSAALMSSTSHQVYLH